MTVCSAYFSFFKNLSSCACRSEDNQTNRTPPEVNILAAKENDQNFHHPACPYIYYYSSSRLTLFICTWNCCLLTLFSARRQGSFFFCSHLLKVSLCWTNSASAATRPASAASTASAAAATRPPPAAPEGRMEMEIASVSLTWKFSSLLA
jgi:hypothetical protein